MSFIERIKSIIGSVTSRGSRDAPLRVRGYRRERPRQVGSDLTLEQIKYVMRDTQVETAYHLFESFLLSRQMTLKKNRREDRGDMGGDVESFVSDIYERLIGFERRLRRDIYTAILYGFSAHEIIYTTKEINGRILLTIDDLIPIHPETVYYDDSFIFDEDTGEFLGLKQNIPYHRQDEEDVPEYIPREKLLFFSFKSHFNDPRGRSILAGIYDNVQFKEDAMRWLLIFLQKHENPTLVGKVSNPANKEGLLRSLEMIDEGLTKITVGKDDSVELVESSKNGDAFFEFIKYNDNVILRQFLIGTLLLGQSDKASGSYAQAMTQESVLRTALEGIHKDIAGSINEVILRLVEYNFGEDAVKSAPLIEFETFTDRHTIELLQALQGYATGLLIDTDSEWFKKLIEYSIQDATGESIPLSPETRVAPVNDLEDLPPGELPEMESRLDDLLRHVQGSGR